MKELEEVNCEIRRVVDLQLSVSNRLKNLETEDSGQTTISQEHNDVSDCYGGFLQNATYAWLSYGCHLVIFNVKIGENISSWTFRGIVTSVSQFPTQSGELPLLLIGIDNNASKLKDSSGVLCIFDCNTSHVLRAIRMPCGIEQVCVVSGGTEWEEFNDKRSDNILNEMDGMACVVLRNLQHIMIDLRRSTWDLHNIPIIMDETSPVEINLISAKQALTKHHTNQERHTAYNLLNSRIEKHIGFNREHFESSPLLGSNLTTAIISSVRIGCLISGCLGRIIIWQNDGSVGWISAPIDDNMAVTHLALLEPTDDPRPFYYLWVVFQDESGKSPPILRMYAMLFERKYCDRGMNLYFNLEAEPSLKFESELNEGDKVISLCTVERESNPEQTDSGIKRGEDNLLLIATNERLLLFDLNQWYKEQMPHTVNECQNPNSILATYRRRSDVQNPDNSVISFAYIPLTLQEFPINYPNSPEELFYPNSLSLEWIELSQKKLIFWMTRGIQTDLLREIAMVGPIVLVQPSETFHKCLSVGLVPFNSEFSFASNQNAQREMLLSLCLEQRWTTFLVKCAVEWSDGSASYLYPTFLKWGVQRASTIKIIADRLCIPLFDQSGSSIGEADVKTLRFCSQQLDCLSNVVSKLPLETTDLIKQRRTLKRVSTYFQVLLWFYDVGLLPETQDLEEDTLPISLALKVPYPYEKLSTLYKEKCGQTRANKNSGSENEQELFIDELITRECPILKEQWEKEGGTTMYGCYPPPSLQSLLRSYLTDCHQKELNEISCKHQITIYLLMDLAMLLQRMYPGVDQLIKYPSAFKMSPSLIKLTQAFWLLDHEDYQGFLDMMTGQLVADSDVKNWHHKLILRTLVRSNQHKLALVYLRVRKPPLSSVEQQGVAVSLSVEHGLVQSAFHRRPPCHYEQLLLSFFQACKTYGKLEEVLHLALDFEEEEVFVKFLEENKTEDLRLLYYLQRCRYTEAINGQSIVQYQSNFTKKMQSTSLGMLDAYNTTLPDITKHFSTNIAAANSDVDLESRYPRPMSHCKSHDKLRGMHETVIAKAKETYLRGEKCQIPFISAPSISLRLNNYSTNMNCVLFPALVHKNRGKRTLDQIYEEDNEINETPDGVKRRKLSDGKISPSKLSIKESGLTATFETPLVQRKYSVLTNKDTVAETPQSILKIRQLIRNSTSPDVVTSQVNEVTNGSPNEKEKKINRQIRFNIHQSKKALTYEDENEESKEDSNKMNISGESNDVFFSPNKSYSESAVLSGNSNCSKSYCPRPRPSLRRSALQKSVESLQQSYESTEKMASSECSVTASPICDEVSKSKFVADTSGQRSSLLSGSMYSTTVLSSGSSLEISGSSSRLERANSHTRWKSSTGRNRQNKFAISSTPLTKNIVSRTRVFDDQSMEIDDDSHYIKSRITETNKDFKISGESAELSNIEQFSSNTCDIREQQGDLEESAQRERQRIESRYNNGNIAKNETSSLKEPYEEQPILSESVKVTDSNLTSSDEFDEELLRLQSEEEENDEHDETFESLPATLEDTQENKVNIPSSLEIQTSRYKVEEPHVMDPIHLQKSIQIINDIDFTDDESSRSRDATSIVPDESNNNEKEEYLSTSRSENILYYMSNITDDESDSTIRETEELKEGDTKLLHLQDRYTLPNIEKNSESKKMKQKLNRKEFQKKSSETENSSISKENQRESKEKQPVRMTRSRKIESLVNSPAIDSSTQEEEIDRFTHLRRGSLAEKNSTAHSSRDAENEKTPRLRRASSISKDSNTDNEVTSRLRREETMDSPVNSSSQDVDPEKPLRLRRANSKTKDIKIDSSLEKPRSRRASSLIKDVLTKSMTIDADVKPVTSLVLDQSTDTQLTTKRGRRSASVTKEIKDDDSEDKSVLLIRRSTRLSASSKKKSQVDIPKTLTKSESVSSLPKLISDTEDDKNTKKRSTRGKTSSDTDKAMTTRSMRLSITELDKEEPEKMDLRRRSNSVPKEIILTQIGRRRRSSSVIKEIIPEEDTEISEDTMELRTSIIKNAKEIINSPATNTRSRRLSTQSVPDELEEILSKPLRETRSSKKDTAQSNIREKRASSVDVPHKEVKKRVRTTHMRSIATEPIVEEPFEREDRIEFQESKKVDSEVVRNVPTRRKRAASTTTIDDVKKDTLKKKQGRTRKMSSTEETGNIFSFSQPEKTDDIPLDEKDIGEVPNYIFSPPQTRSKSIAPNQHQK